MGDAAYWDNWAGAIGPAHPLSAWGQTGQGARQQRRSSHSRLHPRTTDRANPGRPCEDRADCRARLGQRLRQTSDRSGVSLSLIAQEGAVCRARKSPPLRGWPPCHLGRLRRHPCHRHGTAAAGNLGEWHADVADQQKSL